MTREEMRKQLAETLRAEVQRMMAEGLCSYETLADAAIALIRPETLEEAAKEMERLNIYNAAAAIRALKDKP